tara:strand:+ start:1094 stop:1696 length:603 start_codon:yes stop_codon:yes gene_type:complete
MKIVFYLSLLFIMISCVKNNQVYWCGDHPCINKKEKEAYFKKTMVVEMKDLKNENFDNKSEIEKIIKQAKLDEKNRIKKEKDLIKESKLDKKMKIKEEKRLAKQIKLDQKRLADEEKKLAKQIALEDKKREKNEKKLAIQTASKKKNDKVSKIENEKNVIKIDTNIGILKNNSNKFKDLVDKITKRNSLRAYPNINDIPN